MRAGVYSPIVSGAAILAGVVLLMISAVGGFLVALTAGAFLAVGGFFVMACVAREGRMLADGSESRIRPGDGRAQEG